MRSFIHRRGAIRIGLKFPFSYSKEYSSEMKLGARLVSFRGREGGHECARRNLMVGESMFDGRLKMSVCYLQ